jgi:hypothetical protein
MAQSRDANTLQLIAQMQELTAAVQQLVATQQTAAQELPAQQLPAVARRLPPGRQLTAAAQELVEQINAHPDRDAVLARINQSRNEIMIALINSHNPYTSNDPGDMSVFVGNPDPEQQADNINQIELEVDGPYSMTMEWNFKGSPQKINKTLRIKYRYRARNLENPTRPLVQPPHWVTAYMLIGYEDGGA